MKKKVDPLRILAWMEFFKLHKEHFNSLLKQYKSADWKAAWQKILYSYFVRELLDREIIDEVLNTNKSLLFEEDGNLMIEQYMLIYNDISTYYSNKNFSFITAFDEDYPRALSSKLDKLEKNIDIQYIPIIFIYKGDSKLLNSSNTKLGIIGTRECADLNLTIKEIKRIHNKYPNALCVTGLASGVDSIGVLEFDKSVCFIGEDLVEFTKRKQRDNNRFKAKKKVLDRGIVLSHKYPHEIMSSIDFKSALLERNLFVVLLSDSIHPIEFGIKSGTISAINHAIKNKKEIFTPTNLVSEDVVLKYKDSINFY